MREKKSTRNEKCFPDCNKFKSTVLDGTIIPSGASYESTDASNSVKCGRWDFAFAACVFAVICCFVILCCTYYSPGVSLTEDDSPVKSSTVWGDCRTDKLVNINTADTQELAALPGVGDVLAGHIVEYRTQHGEFRAVEEIMRVDGIGKDLYDSVKAFITVDTEE